MKRTSKPNKAASRKSRSKLALTKVADDLIYSEEDSTLALPAGMQNRKYMFTAVAVVVIIALAFIKFNYLVIPARIGGQPIFMWTYLNYLHKNYGKEGMQRLTTQELINQAIAKSKVTVKAEDIQKEIDILDKQASASGGIQAMLTAQQMTLADLKDQLRIQMAVKIILKDKITVTDQEVTDAYKKNRDLFKGSTEADAKKQVRDQLENQKFQTEATAWLAQIRKDIPVQILFPSLVQTAQ